MLASEADIEREVELLKLQSLDDDESKSAAAAAQAAPLFGIDFTMKIDHNVLQGLEPFVPDMPDDSSTDKKDAADATISLYKGVSPFSFQGETIFPDDLKDPRAHFDSATGQFYFNSKADLDSFMSEECAKRGFFVWNKIRNALSGHYRCWYGSLHDKNRTLVGIPRHLRPRADESCSFCCGWKVSYYVHKDGKVYTQNNSACFVHAGHEGEKVTLPQGSSLNSARHLDPELVKYIVSQLQDDVPTRKIRMNVVRKFGPRSSFNSISDETWKQMLSHCRELGGLKNNEKQVQSLFQWLCDVKAQNNPLDKGGQVYWVPRVDSDGRCNAIFFINDIMKMNLQRNYHLLSLDSTCNTNRYNMYLVIISCIDHQFRNAIVAVGLLQKEDTDNYRWFMNQFMSAVKGLEDGDKIWNKISVIAIDGDPVFPAVLNEFMPHVKQLRCMFHMSVNMAVKLSGKLKQSERSGLRNDFFGRLRNVTDKSKWESEWNTAMSKYPCLKDKEIIVAGRRTINPLRKYMDEWVAGIKENWVLAWLFGCTTFDLKGTSRSESIHAFLKKIISNGTHLALLIRLIHEAVIHMYLATEDI